jgi:hypothetical protein
LTNLSRACKQTRINRPPELKAFEVSVYSSISAPENFVKPLLHELDFALGETPIERFWEDLTSIVHSATA